MAAYPGLIRNGVQILDASFVSQVSPRSGGRGGDKTRRVRIPNWNDGSQWKRDPTFLLISVDLLGEGLL